MTNKELVSTAITEVFANRDIAAFDKYFGDNYLQHNPSFPMESNVLRQVLPTLPANFGYEPWRKTEKGNILMIHGRYENWTGKNKWW